jgi:hypothetical protein
VIPEVDESLRALLSAACSSPVSVEPVDQGIVLRLTTIREDTTGLPANWEDLRDDRGIVVARRPPIRRYELRYTVTATAPSTTEEHRLLDAMLATVSATATIDPPHLHEDFVANGQPVLIRVAEPISEPISGLTERPLGLDLVVTAPMLLAWTSDVTPAPEEFQLDAGRSVPPPAPIARPPRPMRSRRISEDG